MNAAGFDTSSTAGAWINPHPQPSQSQYLPQTASSNSSGSSDFHRPSTSITVHDFMMLKLIGEGAYAKVLLVRKIDNQRVYALKVLKKRKIEGLKQSERVILERDILAYIPPHPFIVKLHYSFQNESKLFFALDFCPGGELFSILSRKGTFDEDYLKPENVILDKEGYIRIADFGLSKSNIDSDHSAFSFCGTPEYLAPEVLNKSGHGKPVDWWTLGIMIYEMLTGLPAFYVEKNREELFTKILNEPVKIPTDLSKSCKDILIRLLEKNAFMRLGQNGAMEIKDHPWFVQVDWDQLEKKQYKAPFVPIVKHDADVRNFDETFVDQPITESYQDNTIYHQYSNFSFIGSLKEGVNSFQSRMDIE